MLLVALVMALMMAVPTALAESRSDPKCWSPEGFPLTCQGVGSGDGGGKTHIRNDHPPHGGGDQHGGGEQHGGGSD